MGFEEGFDFVEGNHAVMPGLCVGFGFSNPLSHVFQSQVMSVVMGQGGGLFEMSNIRIR